MKRVARLLIKTNKLNSIEEQCKELQDVINTLNSKFIELAKEAEDKNEIKYLIEGNDMKSKSEEKVGKPEGTKPKGTKTKKGRVDHRKAETPLIVVFSCRLLRGPMDLV